MLQSVYLLAKIHADTAENEQHFAEILPTDGADGADGTLLSDTSAQSKRPRCAASNQTTISPA